MNLDVFLGEAMTWFQPNYWHFVRKIHRSVVDSHHQGPVMQSFDGIFVSLDTISNKQQSDRWNETP